LLAAKGSLRHRTPDRPDEYRNTVNELGTHGSALIRVYCGGVGAKINLVSFEFIHRWLVLENNQLTVVLESRLKPHRHLGQVRVTDLLAFLVDDTPTTGSAKEQTAFVHPGLLSTEADFDRMRTKVAQGVDTSVGLEVAILKPRNGIGWWSDFPNSKARLAVSWVFAAGVTTPFSSDKTEQDATLNSSILAAYPTLGPLISQKDTVNCAMPLAMGCPFKNVAFITPERSRFFRRWCAVLKAPLTMPT